MRSETQSVAPAGPAAVEALLRGAMKLLGTTSESPRLDAELLLAWSLGWDRAALFTRREAAVDASGAERFWSAVRDRQSGRPVAQILGHREFWTLDLRVTADVLTPRPETELLVERALARLPAAAGSRALDLGTGSGAVALAIARERPDCAVVATDASAAALAVARANAAAHGIATVAFRAGDWLDAVPGEVFDVIASNPPYIADAEWACTGRELAFEPRAALSGGSDGLEALRRIVAAAVAHLRPGGWLLLEHGAAQGDAVRGLLSAAGFDGVTTAPDLAGLPRVSEGRRP